MKNIFFILLISIKFLFALNIFIYGITYHFYKPALVKKTYRINNKLYFNPGMGFSKKIGSNNFITISFLKNCYDKNTILGGIYKQLNINNNISFNVGIGYLKTKYSVKRNIIIPIYFVKYKLLNDFAINMSVLPSFTKNNKYNKYLMFIFFSKKIRFK